MSYVQSLMASSDGLRTQQEVRAAVFEHLRARGIDPTLITDPIRSITLRHYAPERAQIYAWYHAKPAAASASDGWNTRRENIASRLTQEADATLREATDKQKATAARSQRALDRNASGGARGPVKRKAGPADTAWLPAHSAALFEIYGAHRDDWPTIVQKMDAVRPGCTRNAVYGHFNRHGYEGLMQIWLSTQTEEK